MNIAINALSAQTGGGVSVLMSLIPYLARIDTENVYMVFYTSQQEKFIETIPKEFRKVRVCDILRNPYVRVLWEQFVFPFYLLQHRVDVLYSLGNTTTILALSKIVLLMENANPYSLIHLSWTRKEIFRLTFLRVLGWLSALRATKIRFISENSKNLILPQLGVSTKKCVVIPHGVLNVRGDTPPITSPPRGGEKQFPPLPEGRLGGVGAHSYLLTIGANGPHRNTGRLLKVFSILVTKYGYDGDLMIVGNTGAHQWRATLDKLVQEFELEARVRFVGEVPHREICSYFKYADVFVFPSIEETFGIPLIEAMGFGVPIAASDCDLDPAYRGRCFNPFREICGNAAQYFNPFSVQNIAECIYRILTDETLREQLIAQGKNRVKKYDLENTARTLVRLFDTMGSPH